jgi:hypothetical protein
MQMDLNVAEKTPKQLKEVFRVKNSLNVIQVSVKLNDSIRKQRKNVDMAVTQVTIENTKLAVLYYEAKAAEISNDIQKLLNAKLKFIPSSDKIMNYVKPNMRKRRFSEQILPKVTTQMKVLIDSLRSQYQRIQTNLTNQLVDHPTTANVRENLAPDTLEMNINVARQPEIPNMDVEDNWTLVECRKRKNVRNPSITPTASDDEHTNITKDNDPQPPKHNYKFKRLTNKVRTASEAFITYKTYAPQSLVLPIMSNPPDSPRLTVISEQLTTMGKQHLENICAETEQNSEPNYSLITFHNGSHENFPKTHICTKISPTILSNNSLLDTIPKEVNFVYELLLMDNGFINYKSYLPNFVAWVNNRRGSLIFSIEEKYFPELNSLFPNLVLHEISRPFQENPCASSIT